jgi:hypothetical protein
MKRSLTIGLAALFLAGCGGGGSMSVPAGTNGAASTQPNSAVRTVRTVRKTYDYTLSVKPYPPGFNPGCGDTITMWELLPNNTGTVANPLNITGLEQPAVNIGPCNAASGNSMHAILDVDYGHMRFIATGNGNFKIDSVDDSAALLTVTDNTTGYSANQYIYLSY